MEKYKLYFCRNVKYLRRRNRITQKDMAGIMGIGIDRLRHIEQNQFPERLSGRHICRIADYFGVTTDSLFLPMENADV